MAAYYNEIDPYAAQWLRNLIAAGHIADGEVDERSIVEVQPDDLRGFTQCHFFAGIGGWSHALRLAGWSDARPIWTGSAPCQPFSSAGKGEEFADERHLWPAFFRLARECRPVAIAGEQVASKSALAWLDHVCADLESEGYAVGSVDTCAAGVGAPHIRQRLYWMADADGRDSGAEGLQRGWERGLLAEMRGACDLGDAIREGPQGRERSCDVELHRGAQPLRPAPAAGATGGFWSGAEWILCRDGKARPVEPGTFPLAHGIPGRVGRLRAYGNAIVPQVAAEIVKAFMEVA